MNRPGTVAIPPSSFQHIVDYPAVCPAALSSRNPRSPTTAGSGPPPTTRLPETDAGHWAGSRSWTGWWCRCRGASASAWTLPSICCFFVLPVTRTTVFGMQCSKAGNHDQFIFVSRRDTTHQPLTKLFSTLSVPLFPTAAAAQSLLLQTYTPDITCCFEVCGQGCSIIANILSDG